MKLTQAKTGIRKAKNCVSNQMRLTYDPKDSDKRRSKMCPDVNQQKWCGRSRSRPPQPSLIAGPHAPKVPCRPAKADVTGDGTASHDVDCASVSPGAPCNPYSNLMKLPVNNYKHDPFHMSCDEFPFGKFQAHLSPNCHFGKALPRPMRVAH
jgi:hypothetical protein